MVCGLCRANDRDIQRGIDALTGAKAWRMHTFIATSPLHMKVKLRMTPGAGARADAAVGALREERLPGRRVLARGRQPLRGRLPLPRARGGDRRGRDDDQHSGHGRLRGARAVRRLHPDAAREDSQLRQGGVERALPQRPRHGGCELARRGADRRGAPDRVHDQRPGRARRQHLARGSGDGGAHARRLLQPRDAASTPRRSCRPRAW